MFVFHADYLKKVSVHDLHFELFLYFAEMLFLLHQNVNWLLKYLPRIQLYITATHMSNYAIYVEHLVQVNTTRNRKQFCLPHIHIFAT